jgi:serine beta-lactamase-like protein LACTB, mitochondrial
MYTTAFSKLLLIYFIVLLSFSGEEILSQQNSDTRVIQLEEYLAQYQKVKNVPSISAGILSGDSIYWIGAKGFTDLENSVPSSQRSLYRIASISKPITAVAIMQLWEKGLLNLDDDVRKYVPYFPQKRWPITIRQILNHTSGIRSYREGEFHSKSLFPNTREALKVFDKDSLLFKPGTDYLYSTLSYTLLASVIESISRKPYAVYIRENILIPAQMNSTFIDAQREIISGRARGYTKTFFRKLENAQLADLSIKVAGGGFISNVNDLLLFSKALLNETLIRKTTLDTMLTPTRISRTFIKNYGLGFSLPENSSDKIFFHNGSGTGFTSRLMIDRVSKTAAVHLINIADRNLQSPADELLKIFKGQEFIQPGFVISDTLMADFLKGGLESVFNKLNEITNNDTSGFSLDHSDIAGFGKDLIQQKRNLEAIDYLKFVNRLFPDSFPIIVALADAYLNDDNKGLALRNYRIANGLDKKDRYVNNMIKRLSN